MTTIPRGGREYLRWDVTSSAALTDPPAVAFLLSSETPSAATTWVAGEWDGAATTNAKGESVRPLRVLVSAPDAPAANPSGTPLASGYYLPRVRVADSPETVIRDSTEALIIG